MRGDYPWNADAIGIPVFLYGMFVFPITLFFLVRGLRHYRADVFLFTWGSGHFLHILLWTLLAVCPVALGSIGMLIDSFEGRHYWVTAFFLLHCYCLLILRASIVTHASSSTDV